MKEINPKKQAQILAYQMAMEIDSNVKAYTFDLTS